MVPYEASFKGLYTLIHIIAEQKTSSSAVPSSRQLLEGK